MRSDEKGASKPESKKSSNPAGKTEKNLKKVGGESSSSKNASILDFLGNSKDSQALSSKKRKRSDNESENSDSDNEENNKNISKNTKSSKEVVSLLDDSPIEESKNKNSQKQNSPAKKKKFTKDTNLDQENSANNNSETKKEKGKKNRENCSICRTGGDLLLCDHCPKSFHMECLKMKSTDVPEGEWFCPSCEPLIEKRKKKQETVLTLDEKKIQKREKRRLYRLKKKEEMRTGQSGSKMISLSAKKVKSKKLKANSKHTPVKNLSQLNFSELNNYNNPINLILAESENKSVPLVPLVSDEIQSKMLVEKMRMQESLFNKLKSKGTSIVTPNGKHSLPNGNRSIDSFFSAVGKAKDPARVIDLTEEEARLKKSLNILPTEEEAKEMLSKITQGKVIDLAAMKKLDTTNPILYAKVHNLYMESLKPKSGTNFSKGEVLKEFNAKELSLSSLPMSQSIVLKKNVKYPIEDAELYRYHEAYALNKECLVKPDGTKSLIPSEHLTKIFKIWDFMHSFKNKLNISEFSPEQLYFALNHFTEEEIPLITDIHSAFIFVIGEQLISTDYSVLMNNDDNELTLVKILIENHSAPKRFFYKKSWVEILRMVLCSKMYNMMITEDLVKLAARLKHHDSRNYNMLSYEEKMMLLEFLLNTVIDLDYIRDAIKSDMENRAELNKEKVGLQNELKMIESRKREIERQEKFTKPKEKVEALTKRINTLVEDNPTFTRQSIFKLRKELENEREEFRSVIKEAEEIESNRIKINARIDKITAEMREIPSTNKKLIGVDGFRNEYYFFPHLNTKLYLKKFKGSRKNYEWREFTTEDEIKDLLSKLSEKGINEKNLITKLNKLFPKRLKLKKSINKETMLAEDKMIIDDEIQIVEKNDNDLSKEFLKSALEWRNTFTDKLNKKIESADPFDEITQRFIDLEDKITDYFYQDDKEWESHDMRQSFKAWLNMTQLVPELAKVILMFNYRFKTPYKINDTKTKIIDDEEEYQGGIGFSIFKIDHTLEPYGLNPKRTIAPKARLWSRELEGMDEFFCNYVHEIKSIPSLYLGLFIFESIFNDLVKRRELYKKKGKDSTANNFDDDVSSSNRDANPPSDSKNKKVDFDDFYYHDSMYNDDMVIDVETSYPSKPAKNNIATASLFNEPSSRTRSRRLVASSNSTKLNNSNIVNNISTKKKTIDWSDNCYICNETGDVLCCEDCPNVSHIFCLGLKKEPEEWRCDQCNYKLANKRLTRSSKH